MKKLMSVLMVGLFAMSLSGCWESDAENAAEDVGESIERTADDMADKTEEAAEDVEEAVKPE